MLGQFSPPITWVPCSLSVAVIDSVVKNYMLWDSTLSVTYPNCTCMFYILSVHGIEMGPKVRNTCF